MSAPTPAGNEPEGPRLLPPAFGRPCPAPLARAHHDHARFLAVQNPDDSTGDHDQDDATRHR